MNISAPPKKTLLGKVGNITSSSESSPWNIEAELAARSEIWQVGEMCLSSDLKNAGQVRMCEVQLWIIQSLFIQPCIPSYKKTILGSTQPVSGINLFFRFSPRLSENEYSRVKSIAKVGPTASNLHYFGIKWCVFSSKVALTTNSPLTTDLLGKNTVIQAKIMQIGSCGAKLCDGLDSRILILA